MLPGASRHHGNTTGARNNSNKPKRPTIPTTTSSSSHASGRPVEDPTTFGRQVPFHCQPSPPTLSGSVSSTTLSGGGGGGGGGSSNNNNTRGHHRSASGSDYDSGTSSLHHHHHHPSYDSNIPTKDKKKTLFRFGRKKGPPTTLSQSPSTTTLHGSSTATPRHRHKRSYDFDYRQPHPLDNTSNFDDRSIYHTVHGSISSGGSSNPFCHRKSPSYGYRKGKDRERSDGSVSSFTKSTRSDSGFKSKDNFDLYVDQDFGSMEGVINPEHYYHMQSQHPTSGHPPNQESSEYWAPPDSWGVVQPHENTARKSVDDDADDDTLSLAESTRYELRKRNYFIRIFRMDGTFATLQLPLTVTAGEIVQKLASKFFMHDLSKLSLVIKRQKLERVLQPHERPIQIQKTLLEQMGYTEQDRIEDVGREDNSYLVRYIFGPNMDQMIHEAVDYNENQHNIDLQARNIQTIPISLYKYASRIISLDLSKNVHMDIPVDFIQMCRHLKQLWLANNEYMAVPPSIRYVRGLEHLNVSGNRLRDLDHAHLEEITGLKTLRAFNNRLETLPTSFKTFKHLTMLFISNNAFQTFPQIICEITSLTYLDISFNRIQSFPEEIGNLKNLVWLFAIANRLTGSLPSSFARLENLQELDIRQNHITSLDVLSKLPKLEILFVGYNAISIVRSEFKNLRQLKMIKNHLTQFNLAGESSSRPAEGHAMSVTGIPPPIACSYEGSMLTNLDLSSCMLTSLPEDVFLSTTLLEELILDNNTLNSIPSSIGALRRLLRLSVQNNFLDSLPSEISSLLELKTLHAQNNNMKELPKEIWLCASLQTLNCSSNLLETFPEPFSVPGSALQLPNMPPQTAAAAAATIAGAERGAADPITLQSLKHSGQGTVPGAGDATATTTTGRGGGGAGRSAILSKHRQQRSMDDSQSPQTSNMQSPPNFNPPSFFASPRNHPPPLSLSLRKLFLGDNRLTNDIWSPLMLFLELRTLNLSFNDLDEIPPEHLCHQHLYELYLSGNHLTSLPADDIEKLSYLRVLAVNGNKLQTLPAEIGKLRKLLVLDVGNNVLKYNIANWPYDWNWNWNLSLKFLNLSGNKRLEIKKTHPDVHSPKEKDLADFSALTRLRMLGLMDVTILGVSIPEESSDRRVRTTPSEVNNMAYGVADWVGSNEHLGTWDLVMPRFRNRDDECIFGLFDGRKSSRTGSKLAKYLNDSLTSHVEAELSKLKPDDTVVSALRRSFLAMEKGLGNELIEDKDTGASAVVCYIAGTKLFVANVGDAMAVISRNNGQASEITHKHIALNPSEIARIHQAGGYVSNTGKLNGEHRVSRGFGYFDMIPVMNANPYVATIELTENDEFVIMASKGLWERMNYQTAVDVARTEKDDLMAAAQKLRDFAITYGAEKDLMVMIIDVGDLFDKRDTRLRYARALGRGGAAADAAGMLLDDVPLGPGGLILGKNKRRGKEESPGDSTLARLDREVPPPINQVALVFTDIKSSTALWDTQPENMRSAIKIHDAVMRRTLRSVGGYEVKTEGDAFMVCFQNITSALLWCFTVQLQLLEADWPVGILASEEGREIDKDGVMLYRGLSVRMGIHWGTPVFERNPITSRMDYFGPVVNKASRICNAADGGQICVSSDVVAALKHLCPTMLDENDSAGSGGDNSTSPTSNYLVNRDIQQLKRLGFRVMELGMRRLKGLETPEMLSFVYPKQLAGRMIFDEPQQQQQQVAKRTPSSPRLAATADTSRTTSPRLEGDTSVEPSRVPSPAEEVEDIGGRTAVQNLEAEFSGYKAPAAATRPVNRSIDPVMVCSLSNLATRLESLTTGHVISRPPVMVDLLPNMTSATRVASETAIERMVESHIMNEATDDELLLLMENFVTRIENAVSALYLQKMGHFAHVLEKLGEAIDLDPSHLLHALQMYTDVTGLAADAHSSSP